MSGWDIDVELDCWDWQAGDNFVAKMTTALDTCDHMLALFSQAYFEPARWTAEEWTAADARGFSRMLALSAMFHARVGGGRT